MNAHTTQAAYFIGQPVEWQRRGWIADIREQEAGATVYTIGAGGMQRERLRLTVVWSDGSYSADISEHIAAPWAENARHLGTIGAGKAAEMLAEAKRRQAESVAEAKREREDAARQVSEWRDSIRDKIPADAKAVIVAKLEHDKSDSMTDYFATTTSRTVILAFSRHTRDLFPEMRKAAARFSETAHLTDAPDSAEHREKWSMGAGYYLKDSGRYSDGWKVEKVPFYGQRNDPAENVPHGEWMVPDGRPYVTGNAPEPGDAAGPADCQTVGAFTIEEHTHTKRGFQMWIVCPAGRVDRDTFTAWLDKAKASGGWYSRKWGSTPAGFAFKRQDAAEQFAEGLAE